ncbi:hypothetical protein PSHT_11943 [Puccinia striiformis]|uniref:Uncharacterized protein n=1 Tax=Puccinia striiformis TaxID=27350 RepID=A0A2S4UZZ2_9BASI|nr:hypothetical protein PSHT_11943 [Puccinia striiformis]
MSDLVIREIVKGTILTFSKPFKRMGIVPIGGRSTAIKLSDSSVWLLASTPLTDETRQQIDQLGPVKSAHQSPHHSTNKIPNLCNLNSNRFIAVADMEHTGFITQYTDAYPEAKVYGPEGVAKKLGINVHEWTSDKNHNPMEYDTQVLKDEIKAEYFDGFINKDIAFLHVPELASNFTSWFGTLSPDSKIHQRFVYNLAATNKTSMAHSAYKVDQWDFDRIIPCHGDVIDTGGKEAWRKTYSLYFDDIKNGKFPGIGTSSKAQ